MLKVSSFLSMSEKDRDEALARPNGAIVEMRKRVASFERRYEMTSDEMRKSFARGELKDTADTSEWLMLLRTMDRVR